MTIRPRYGAINAVRDICEPWIEAWGGDEWGESMWSLYSASHTSYGLTDEDCAIIAEILLRNVIGQKELDEEYGFASEDQLEYARANAREARDSWLKGGNLGDWGTTIEDAKSSIDQMPDWFFGESDA